MLKKSLVSVIIPCYNDGNFLEEAVESVNRSTYPEIEIIIVNDGSIDETKKIGLKLEKEYEHIKFLEQENLGPAVARNKGIKVSKGDYILPLDADDKISDFYIEEAINVFETNSEVKVVYSNAEFFGNKKGKWNLPEFNRNILAKENMIFCSALYKKTDYIKCGGYSDEMTWGWEDWEFWISMLKEGGQVDKIPKTCFYYRIKPNSRRKSTNKTDKKRTVDFINFKHKDFIYRELNGPLRYSRANSKIINAFYKLFNYKTNLINRFSSIFQWKY